MPMYRAKARMAMGFASNFAQCNHRPALKEPPSSEKPIAIAPPQSLKPALVLDRLEPHGRQPALRQLVQIRNAERLLELHGRGSAGSVSPLTARDSRHRRVRGCRHVSW